MIFCALAQRPLETTWSLRNGSEVAVIVQGRRFPDSWTAEVTTARPKNGSSSCKISSEP
jgi:hypothetical protein